VRPWALAGGVEVFTMKNIFQIGLTIIISLVIAVLLSNVIYLSGYIDFYKPELLAYNSIDDLSGHNNRNTVLIMGDSFTAGNTSYPNILRNMLPNYRIINAGISGSGIIQASIIAKKGLRNSTQKFLYIKYMWAMICWIFPIP